MSFKRANRDLFLQILKGAFRQKRKRQDRKSVGVWWRLIIRKRNERKDNVLIRKQSFLVLLASVFCLSGTTASPYHQNGTKNTLFSLSLPSLQQGCPKKKKNFFSYLLPGTSYLSSFLKKFLQIKVWNNLDTEAKKSDKQKVALLRAFPGLSNGCLNVTLQILIHQQTWGESSFPVKAKIKWKAEYGSQARFAGGPYWAAYPSVCLWCLLVLFQKRN